MPGAAGSFVGKRRVIVSASRRTDVPACFGPWFINRIREGWAETAHPFNPRRIKRCSLTPQDVDVIVFWSKNPLPMVEHLEELDERGYGTTSSLR